MRNGWSKLSIFPTVWMITGTKDEKEAVSGAVTVIMMFSGFGAEE